MPQHLFSTVYLLFFLSVLNGQILSKQPLETASNFVEQIKKAQHVDQLYTRKAIAFDIETNINGKVTKATVTTLTNSSKIRLQYADGKVIVFDGKKIWVNSTEAYSDRQARFELFMWQYFFMSPFKMDDAGTHWQGMTDKIIDNNEYARAKLTFKNGTGDTPNDWYIVHRNKATGYLSAMAYIVTFGQKTVSEAEKHPNGITYDDFITMEGVQFATTWQFWKWSELRGFYDAKGVAQIKNIRFLEPTINTFTPPSGSKEVAP
ncbi:MAG: DUF6503 family protein [Saprospiraceae bacterium]|nr:DUF6503 family protein [Saprospiraceae bacterium]